VKALHVLVVEDDSLIGALPAETLEGMGREVCTVEATAEDAVAAAARCKPDMMIVDMRLHDESGVSTVEAVLPAGPVPPCLHLGRLGDGSGARIGRGGHPETLP
jgi:DNA-binding response OmpR family regulator